MAVELAAAEGAAAKHIDPEEDVALAIAGGQCRRRGSALIPSVIQKNAVADIKKCLVH
jgi:hypothetical protein